MAFTQEQLDAIEIAIVSGTTEVSYSDKKVVYRSLRELMALRDLIRKELGLVGASKRLYMEHKKGTD
jgi:hypothetical protein